MLMLCHLLLLAVHESSHPAKNATASEALALALRARQEAEWEMGDDESSWKWRSAKWTEKHSWEFCYLHYWGLRRICLHFWKLTNEGWCWKPRLFASKKCIFSLVVILLYYNFWKYCETIKTGCSSSTESRTGLTTYGKMWDQIPFLWNFLTGLV